MTAILQSVPKLLFCIMSLTLYLENFCRVYCLPGENELIFAKFRQVSLLELQRWQFSSNLSFDRNIFVEAGMHTGWFYWHEKKVTRAWFNPIIISNDQWGLSEKGKDFIRDALKYFRKDDFAHVLISSVRNNNLLSIILRCHSIALCSRWEYLLYIP